MRNGNCRSGLDSRLEIRHACDLVCAWRMLSRMGAQSLVIRENALAAICHFGRSRTSQWMLLPPRNSARHAGQLARVNRLCLSSSGISQSSRNVLRIDNVYGEPSVGHRCLDRLKRTGQAEARQQSFYYAGVIGVFLTGSALAIPFVRLMRETAILLPIAFLTLAGLLMSIHPPRQA